MCRASLAESLGAFHNFASVEQQVIAAPAGLAPQDCGADACKQQGADAVGIFLGLQVFGVALHLNTHAEGADGIQVGARQVFDHVAVGGFEMTGLVDGLINPFADNFQHLGMLSQLGLQMEQAEGVADDFRLGVALAPPKGFDQFAQTQLNAQPVAKDRFGGWGIDHQQAFNGGLISRLGSVALLGNLVDEGCCLKDSCKGNNLIFNAISQGDESCENPV